MGHGVLGVLHQGECGEVYYPFLPIATHETSDLSTIYVLLLKNLALLEKYIEQHTYQFAEEASRLNRKRDDDGGNDVDNDGDEK